ncbi:MAG: hypothetical protein RO009_04340 [Pseudorhodoplanes sp.]|jgi:hypothetical protein|nr:hypothetical protein [Pseudorhodoplanes sp.]
MIARCLVALAAVILASGSVLAQQNVRVRGEIAAVDGQTLVVKSRDGAELKIRLADNVNVSGIVKTQLTDIKPGSYIGVSAMPQPDGSQRALHVHIFPEPMRGVAEGHFPWDVRPNSTMTNATVAETVAGVDGQTITVKYKDGEKKVVVPPEAPIVTYVPGDRADLKPGAKIFIVAAQKQPDGTLSAARVSVGRDGLTPPM